MPVIGSFQGRYAWMSNFYVTPAKYKDVLYKTSEHAYQAAKCALESERQRVADCATPALAKKLGKYVTLVEGWEHHIKDDVMREVVASKFELSPELAARLGRTNGAYLMEGNVWHDNYWGVCFCARCDGMGKNMLGEILMEVRKTL